VPKDVMVPYGCIRIFGILWDMMGNGKKTSFEVTHETLREGITAR